MLTYYRQLELLPCVLQPTRIEFLEADSPKTGEFLIAPNHLAQDRLVFVDFVF